MIFPPESIYEFRRELAAKMADHSLSDLEAYRQALAVDPHDPAANGHIALAAEKDGDPAVVVPLAHRFIEADPLSHEGYALLSRVLPDKALAAAYGGLATQILHYDPEAAARQVPDTQLDAPVADRGPEPEAVTRELEPHRLLHGLFVAGLEPIDASLIDRILARGADCAPLLLGVLNAYGEDLLRDNDGVVVRSLALLGEIGDATALPALARFVPLEDDTIGGAARWGFLRIARRRPAEALEVIRNLAIGAEALDLAALAQQLCLMPDVTGRSEVLLSLADNITEFDKDEIDLVIVSMLTSAHVMHGAASETAAIIETQYGPLLSRAARKELKSLRTEIEEARQEIIEAEEPSIYDVCLEGFDLVDDEPFERNEPKLGRNDPCWCGSGKKYKKCHLDADAGH